MFSLKNVSADLLLDLIARLRAPVLPPNKVPGDTWNEIRKRGWAYASDIDDVIWALDNRLDRVDLNQFFEMLGIKWQYVFKRPRFIRSMSIGMQAIRWNELVTLLAFFENLGFNINAGALARDVAEQVKELEYLTETEIQLSSYDQLTGRTELRLATIHRPIEGGEKFQEIDFKTANGYRVSGMLAGGRPICLTVTGPKYRRRPVPKEITCKDCGVTYLAGDMEQTLSHRTTHARWARIFKPTPSQRALMYQSKLGTDFLINERSPKWLHLEMYDRAVFFKREFSFDFIQWKYPKDAFRRESERVGRLFITDSGVIDGAASFSRRDNSDSDQDWEMDWIWIRPSMRRTGILTENWPILTAQFGDFLLSEPLSSAMESFISRYGSTTQKSQQSSPQTGH